MHEMSLAEGVLQLIEDAAREQAFAKVVGRLAGNRPARRRRSRGHELLLRRRDARQPGRWRAAGDHRHARHAAGAWQCGQDRAAERGVRRLPGCGGYQVQVTGGTEMRVKELEVD